MGAKLICGAILAFSQFPKLALSAELPAKRPLTVADMIETTRPLGLGAPTLLSPDGRRYVVFFEHGDLQRNGTWVQVVSGRTDSLDAAQGEVAAELFTSSKRGVDDVVKQARWLADNERVAFSWDDGENPKILAINLRTHQKDILAQHNTVISDYDVSGDGTVVVYTAQLDHDARVSARMRHEGFAVSDQDIFSLFGGALDGWIPYRHTGLFVRAAGESSPRKLLEQKERPQLVGCSPDGRLALVMASAESLPPSWDRYTEGWFKDRLAAARKSANGTRDELGEVLQYYVVDLTIGAARPLWNAPASVYGRIVWSPDGRRVLISPTFLPAEQAEGPALNGLAAADIDVADGSFLSLPFPANAPSFTTGWREGYRPQRWSGDDVVEFIDTQLGAAGGVKFRFKKADGHWRMPADTNSLAAAEAPVRIELRQDLNTPPAVVAVEVATGKERAVWNSNPGLRDRFSLGRIEEIHWQGRAGQAMTGWLHYPVHFTPGKLYPLVLYFHAPIPGAPPIFSLDGGYTTASAAQPLANKDIAVLQLRWSDRESRDIIGTTREAETIMANAEDAIDHLSRQGWVDRARIGLTGFSRTGWYVEHILVHSTYPFAAALAADNTSDGYMLYVMSWGFPAYQQSMEKIAGAVPFGDGLKDWLRVSTGFNADKIHTPLRLEGDSGGIISAIVGHWELFAQLRRHGRPVELYMVPDSDDQTGHPLQNPRQRLASQGGAVDWFDFWLNGHEDPDPAKAEQYKRWEGLRALQKAQTSVAQTAP